jgi:hypothetical protein
MAYNGPIMRKKYSPLDSHRMIMPCPDTGSLGR